MSRKMFAVILLFVSVQGHAADDKVDKAVLLIGHELASMHGALALYCMKGMKINYKDPVGRIREAANGYEKALDQIKKNFDAVPIQSNIQTSEAAWKGFRKKLISDAADPDALKKDALFIHDNMRTVLRGLFKIKKILLKTDKDVRAPYINAAIDIGASAMRFSSHYLMKLWKLNDPTIDKHWKLGVKHYKEGIALLKKSPWYGDEAFQANVTQCEKELSFFEMMYAMGKGAPTVIDTRSNAVLTISQELISTIQHAK